MQVALALALQAAQAGGPAAVTPIAFDLAAHRPAAEDDADLPLSCRLRDPAEIVVCARRRGGANGYPIDEWVRIFATGPLVAETGIAPNTVVRAYTEQAELGAGQVSKRAMVGIKLGF